MEKNLSRRVTNICVFCGSSSGNNSEFIEAVKGLGKIIAERKMHLVYGGGDLSLIGVVSRAVRDGGSQVLGIILKTLVNENLIGKTNGEEYIVSGMSEKLTEMINHTD